MVQAEFPHRLIDSHVHFWDPSQVYVPWLSSAPHFNERRDAEKYVEALPQGVEVHKAVYVETDVEPTQGLVEAEWIARYAQQLKMDSRFGGIGGIVAYAPVNIGEPVRHYLRVLTQLIPKDRHLRGVRYLVQDPDQNPARISSPTFIQGVKTLREFGLSFDLNFNCHVAPEQFTHSIELVRQCPEVSFILDHMGKPPCDCQPGDEAFSFWRENIIAIGKLPNISCKVSGLVTETNVVTAQQLAPFVKVALEAFGIDRLMYGGDWPVVENSAALGRWLDVISEIVADWSDEDKDKLFYRNAQRIYRLDL
ncbi:hypothetical protein BX666DRAFT_1960998 [Dichotomocladium elegans]|nr:hypothetical protein BX666DRAFT_1960998 [Dichotomocladium elegans]